MYLGISSSLSHKGPEDWAAKHRLFCRTVENGRNDY